MGPSEGLELDRIENDEGYRLGNCRWADKITNANNRRSNVFIEHRGERLTIAQWARQIGISNQKMWGLLKRGHSIAFIEEEYAA
jgi:hypothetical protein